MTMMSGLNSSHARHQPEPDGTVGKGSTATFDRLLLVLEEIARGGPITLTELSDALPMSRGAIWRAAQALRRRGWIRIRQSDNAFEISTRIDDFFAKAHVASPESEEYEILLESIRDRKQLHVAVGIFSERGRFIISDSSQRNTELGQSVSLVFDDMALAAQSICSEPDLKAHLNAYVLKAANQEEREIIENGEHRESLKRISELGIVWSETQPAFAIPVCFRSGTCGAISFISRDWNRASKEMLSDLAHNLMTCRTASSTEDQIQQITELVDAVGGPNLLANRAAEA